MKLKPIALASIAFASLHSEAQAHLAHRFVLTTEQVSRALAPTFAKRGIQPEQARVSLLATVVSKEQYPALDVDTIEPLGHISSDRQGEVSSAVKLSCHQREACLPFYAIVALPIGSDLLSQKAKTAVSNGTQIATHRAEIVMKMGKPATLIMDSSQAHIQISVVSMQNGSLGQKIRVASPDHKQTYLAEVLSANTVKGTF